MFNVNNICASLRLLHSGSCTYLPLLTPKCKLETPLLVDFKQLSLPPDIKLGATALATGISLADPAPLYWLVFVVVVLLLSTVAPC